MALPLASTRYRAQMPDGLLDCQVESHLPVESPFQPLSNVSPGRTRINKCTLLTEK